MKTGPPSPKSHMLAAITTTPQVTIHKLTLEEIESLTSSLSDPPSLKLRKKISNNKLQNERLSG